jgi:oxaloacetate decarboxylase alpha subunit
VVSSVPKLVDTTIRLLSQEPLCASMPTGEVLRIAEILDGAGFACLEVSGGGAFDASVRRGVESPWERIRALDARTKTPLGIALRGRFLVGARPVSADVSRRFIACAAENGIDMFRLHDPLNDVGNLRDAGAAIAAEGRELHVGLVYSRGRSGETDVLVDAARRIPELGASRIILSDPTDALRPHLTEELVTRIHEATGLPVGLHVQGAAGTALLNAVVATRVHADWIATAVYPLALSLHRVSSESLVESLHGLGRETGVDLASLWQAADVIDDHIGDEPVAPLSPRIAVRAAEHDLPAGLVAALDTHLRASGAGDRLLDTLVEVQRIRADAGWPPLATPIGQILGSQALLNVLSARRYGTVLDEFRLLVTGAYGTAPAPVDPAVLRAVELFGAGGPALDDDPPSTEDVRVASEGLAAAEEDLVLLALFGDEAEALLRTIRQRHSRESSLLVGDVDAARAERIRELVKIVQESGVGEIEIEDAGMRVSVRRADEPTLVAAVPFAQPPTTELDGLAPTSAVGVNAIESPMVGVFYRASKPGSPPFVEVGEVVTVGQTLCLIEAMKLFNEIKADMDGRVVRIAVEDAQTVEFGTVLFELEPVATAPPVV